MLSIINGYIVYIHGHVLSRRHWLDTVVMSGDDVCCSVVFGTLVGVFVFSDMRSQLLMTSVICCPLWSSVYEYHKVECAFTSPVRTECGMLMFVMCYMFVSTVL